MADLRRRAGIVENTNEMSTGAAQVVARTMQAVQDLDEMGGSESRSDYIIAMNELIGELTRRRDTAAKLMQTDGNNFG